MDELTFIFLLNFCCRKPVLEAYVQFFKLYPSECMHPTPPSETKYENLGLAWNPEEDNVCWIYKRDGELKIEFSYDAKARNIIICISKK